MVHFSIFLILDVGIKLFDHKILSVVRIFVLQPKRTNPCRTETVPLPQRPLQCHSNISIAIVFPLHFSNVLKRTKQMTTIYNMFTLKNLDSILINHFILTPVT